MHLFNGLKIKILNIQENDILMKRKIGFFNIHVQIYLT